MVRHIPPAPSGSSKNPNHVLAFNLVDDHFLNRENHEQAVAIIEGWKPQPWKGQVWRGAGKDNINRVWTGPVHFDLVWNGIEWVPCNTAHSALVDPGSIDFNFPAPGAREVTAGLVKAISVPNETGELPARVKKCKTLHGAAKLKAEEVLNAAYVLYAEDPIEQNKGDFYGKLAAYLRGTRSNAMYLAFAKRSEMYLDAEDVLGEFLLKVASMIERKKYLHEGKIQNC